MDTPYWYFKWIYGNPGINQLKKNTLEFCGIKPVKVSVFSPVRNMRADVLTKYLEKTEQLGKKLV